MPRELTAKDKNFLRALKNQGVNMQDAFLRLDKQKEKEATKAINKEKLRLIQEELEKRKTEGAIKGVVGKALPFAPGFAIEKGIEAGKEAVETKEGLEAQAEASAQAFEEGLQPKEAFLAEQAQIGVQEAVLPPARAVGEVISPVVEQAGSAFMSFFPENFRKLAGKGVELTAEQLSGAQESAITGLMESKGISREEAERRLEITKGTIEAGLELTTLGIGGKPAVTGVKKGAKLLEETLEETAEQSLKRQAKEKTLFAEELITPKRTKKQFQKEFVKKGKKAKLFEAEIELTPRQKEIAKDVAQIDDVKSGLLGGQRAKKNIVAINEENANIARNLKKSLEKEGGIFPEKELSAKINKVRDAAREEVFLSDAQKRVDAIYRKWDEIMKGRKKTVPELWEARKEFDKWISSQDVNPWAIEKADKALYRNVRELRKTINDFLAEKAVNTDVKQSFRTMSNLFEAVEDISTKIDPKQIESIRDLVIIGGKIAIPAAIGAGVVGAIKASD